MIKFEYLRYFQAAAENKSFSHASKQLYVSSTSIVNAVNQIESHYGINLFVRKKSIGLALTPDGQKLLKYSRPLINDMRHLDDIFQSSKDSIKGELVVGCQEGLTWSLIPRVIAKLKIKYPELKINMKTIWMDERMAPIERGEIDILISFLVNEITHEGLTTVVLCRPNTCALMRKGHPLDNGKPVYIEQLAQYPQIMIEDGDAFNLFYDMYVQKGFQPEILMRSNISPGAQAICGSTDAISLRILRPAHGLSPLGDEIVFPMVIDHQNVPDLVAITNNFKQCDQKTKHSVFIDELKQSFDSGEMKQHIYY